MTLRYSRAVAAVTVIAALTTALGLSACQTTSPPTPPPAAAKPADAPKPITPEAARNLANNCFTCHGPNGRSPGSMPSLWTLSADDIAKRLKDFKSGAAPSTVMSRHAKGYTDAELEAVARYIAGLKK